MDCSEEGIGDNFRKQEKRKIGKRMPAKEYNGNTGREEGFFLRPTLSVNNSRREESSLRYSNPYQNVIDRNLVPEICAFLNYEMHAQIRNLVSQSSSNTLGYPQIERTDCKMSVKCLRKRKRATSSMKLSKSEES